jgi:DNA-binding transcriptional LysR family regulator
MDLKRLRTFVAVADLGTVSRAALRLRISRSALSRQISDLEYECGFKLFDRIGRRLFLTTRGEQVLGDCRGVLGQMGALGERIELLKRGDSGVLKLAAPAADNRKRPVGISAAICRTLPQRAREVDGSSWPGSGADAGARRGSCWDQARPRQQPPVREPCIAARRCLGRSLPRSAPSEARAGRRFKASATGMIVTLVRRMTSWREAAAMSNEKGFEAFSLLSGGHRPFGRVASITLPDIKSANLTRCRSARRSQTSWSVSCSRF